MLPATRQVSNTDNALPATGQVSNVLVAMLPATGQVSNTDDALPATGQVSNDLVARRTSVRWSLQALNLSLGGNRGDHARHGSSHSQPR